MTTTTTSNHALLIAAPGEEAIREVPIPHLRDDYILVRVHAVALNPTDWKHVDFVPSPGAHLGCDYAGVVHAVGSKVTKPFKPGDRVCGFTHGGNATHHEDGCFGTIITAKGDLQIRIPDHVSFEEAATFGVGITTVGQTLYQTLQLPLPTSPAPSPFPILIHGASSATGALAVQFAALSGLTVIATCSPPNFAYVRSLGAAAVFDYNSPSCAEDIRKQTDDALHHVVDCISERDSAAICAAAMSPTEGGKYVTILPVPSSAVSKINARIEMKSTLAYTVFGEEFAFGPRKIPASQTDFEFGVKWWEIVRGLLEEGKVRGHRFVVDGEDEAEVQGARGKGLEGVMLGLKAMRQGRVRGRKLVYHL